MPTDCISFRDTNYFSSFICDYLDESPELKVFYNRFPKLENFKYQIEEKTSSYDKSVREVLTNQLEQQYQHIETSELTLQNIESIRSENTFTITTGHQLNLFTGPLYFLHKIVSTINLTKALKTEYPDYNFVPVYWMASEDHDFDEINYFNFRGKKIQWNREDGGAVGRFDTEGLDDILNIISAKFGEGRNAKQLIRWFKEAYINHNNLSDATRYLANALFSEYGLVIIDADDRELKRLFIPQMQKELLELTSYTTVKETNNKIEALGLNIQVNPRAINLFYLGENLRERILFEDGIFKVNNTAISWT